MQTEENKRSGCVMQLPHKTQQAKLLDRISVMALLKKHKLT